MDEVKFVYSLNNNHKNNCSICNNILVDKICSLNIFKTIEINYRIEIVNESLITNLYFCELCNLYYVSYDEMLSIKKKTGYDLYLKASPEFVPKHNKKRLLPPSTYHLSDSCPKCATTKLAKRISDIEIYFSKNDKKPRCLMRWNLSYCEKCYSYFISKSQMNSIYKSLTDDGYDKNDILYRQFLRWPKGGFQIKVVVFYEEEDDIKEKSKDNIGMNFNNPAFLKKKRSKGVSFMPNESAYNNNSTKCQICDNKSYRDGFCKHHYNGEHFLNK